MRFALGRFALGGAPRSVSALRACRALRSVSALRAWWRFALVALRAQSVRFAHGALRACSPPPPSLYARGGTHRAPPCARLPPPRGGRPPQAGSVRVRVRAQVPALALFVGWLFAFQGAGCPRRCAGRVRRVGLLVVRRLACVGQRWHRLGRCFKSDGVLAVPLRCHLGRAAPVPCTGLPDAAPLLALPALAAACGGCKPCPALFMPLASLSFPLATA